MRSWVCWAFSLILFKFTWYFTTCLPDMLLHVWNGYVGLLALLFIYLRAYMLACNRYCVPLLLTCNEDSVPLMLTCIGDSVPLLLTCNGTVCPLLLTWNRDSVPLLQTWKRDSVPMLQKCNGDSVPLLLKFNVPLLTWKMMMTSLLIWELGWKIMK